MTRWRLHPGTTVAYGLIWSLGIYLIEAGGPQSRMGPQLFNAILAVSAAFYSLLIGRRRQLPWMPFFFATLIAGMAMTVKTPAAGIVLAAAVLGWVRTGTSGPSARGWQAAGELICLAACIGLAAVFYPGTAAAGGLGLWLFYLLQTVPLALTALADPHQRRRAALERFEAARRRVEDILAGDF